MSSMVDAIRSKDTIGQTTIHVRKARLDEMYPIGLGAIGRRRIEIGRLSTYVEPTQVWISRYDVHEVGKLQRIWSAYVS